MDTPKRLLFYDPNYSFHVELYNELEQRDVELERIFSIKRMHGKDLSQFRGFVASPSRERQEEFAENMARHPRLRVAIVTPSPQNYRNRRNIKVFDTGNSKSIYEYFFGKRG